MVKWAQEALVICHSRRQADWSNFRVPNSPRSDALSISSLRKISLSCSCLKACGLFRDPLPVVCNRGRLDTSRKQVQCHRCFLFARRCLPSENTKHVDALWESTMFVPAVIFVTNDEVTHYRKLAESEGKRLQRRRSLCQEAFFVFSGCTWKSTGFVHAVCMRGEDWEILGVLEAHWRKRRKFRRWRKRERARAGIEPTAAAPSQPDCPGVSRSDHSAGSKESASWRALELRSDWHGRLGVGSREKEGKETSGRGSQDEPAQDKEENGSWTNSAKR